MLNSVFGIGVRGLVVEWGGLREFWAIDGTAGSNDPVLRRFGHPFYYEFERLVVTTRDLLLHVVRLRIRLHSPYQLYTDSLKWIKWWSVSVVQSVAYRRPNVGQMRSRQQKLTIIISMHRIFKISAIFAAYRDVLSLKDLIINEQMNKFFPPEDFCFPRASNAKLFLD